MMQSVEYSKMIYLDGDIQVFHNIDHLFDLPDGKFYAVMDCFCAVNSPQYQNGYCQLSPQNVQWPDCPKPPLYFNAGMFVFEPNLSTYYDLLESVKTTPPTLFAEQDFLNVFFRDVYEPLPTIYNFILPMLWRHPENVELDKIKVVHYCAESNGSKPWRFTGEGMNMDRDDIKMLMDKWWDIHNDETLDYRRIQVTAVDTPTPALTKRGHPCYVTAPSAAA